VPQPFDGNRPCAELRRAFESAAATIAVSPALAARIRSLGLPCSAVVPNAIDGRRFDARPAHSSAFDMWRRSPAARLPRCRQAPTAPRRVKRWNLSAIFTTLSGDFAKSLSRKHSVSWPGTCFPLEQACCGWQDAIFEPGVSMQFKLLKIVGAALLAASASSSFAVTCSLHASNVGITALGFSCSEAAGTITIEETYTSTGIGSIVFDGLAGGTDYIVVKKIKNATQGKSVLGDSGNIGVAGGVPGHAQVVEDEAVSGGELARHGSN
jgi:hypothetical protein